MEKENSMIESPIVFNFFKYGEPFFGSYHPMRYMVSRQGEKPDYELVAVTWPEPFCYEVTPDEQKEECVFPFDEEGYVQALAWLNHQYENYSVK